MSTTEIIHVPQGNTVSRASDFMPVFDITQAIERQKAMSAFIGQILHEGGDYGVIPGTNKQKVLLKPGAEKLCTFFGLSPRFEAEHIIEDWSGKGEGGGEPLFYYRYKCQLWRGDRLLAEAVGSCNSREKKYRWRGSERVCPQCGKPTIIKGKAEYGGGFLCFAKKGGCGAKFSDTDQSITSQEVGQVPNPDIAEAVNTIQKMAQKRALVAAVLIGTNTSDSFTQDIEEQMDESEKPLHRIGPDQGNGTAVSESGIPEVDTLWKKIAGDKFTKVNIKAVIDGLYDSLVEILTDHGAKVVYSGIVEKCGDPFMSGRNSKNVTKELYLALQEAKSK